MASTRGPRIRTNAGTASACSGSLRACSRCFRRCSRPEVRSGGPKRRWKARGRPGPARPLPARRRSKRQRSEKRPAPPAGSLLPQRPAESPGVCARRFFLVVPYRPHARRLGPQPTLKSLGTKARPDSAAPSPLFPTPLPVSAKFRTSETSQARRNGSAGLGRSCRTRGRAGRYSSSQLMKPGFTSVMALTISSTRPP